MKISRAVFAVGFAASFLVATAAALMQDSTFVIIALLMTILFKQWMD